MFFYEKIVIFLVLLGFNPKIAFAAPKDSKQNLVSSQSTSLTEPEKISTHSFLLSRLPKDLTEALCAFDIDGTLIEPSEHDPKKRVPVEANLTKVLRLLADRGCTIIALTARIPGERTKKELEEAGLDFFTHADFPKQFSLNDAFLYKTESGDASFVNSILFASNSNKGEALTALLQSKMSNSALKSPTLISFVDDAISEGRNVLKAMGKLHIKTYTFRYLPPHHEDFEY